MKNIFAILILILSTLSFSNAQNLKLDKKGIDHPKYRGIYTNPHENTELEGVLPVEKQDIFIPYRFEEKQRPASRSNDVIATGEGSDYLFPGDYSYFKVNTNTKTVTYFPMDYGLHSTCQTAIDKAPDWLEKELMLQFIKLEKFNLDDDYAALIVSASNEICDEVAFQVAHIAVQTLASTRFKSDMDLIVRNAQWIYDMVDSLKYVRLKEYGTFAAGDYYTTTEYRVKNGPSGDTIWSEIPSDIYYWHVVHPKIDREALASKHSSSDQTYGYFYKEYIWYNPDPDHDYRHVDTTMVYVDAYKQYMPGIYKGDSAHKHRFLTLQRFGELMQKPEILWNRHQTYYDFLRDYKDSDHALNVLGNWASRAIPVITDGKVRPFQPNQALYEHNGNCHEDAILIVAACKTALIPVVHRNSSGEDHAFAAIYDDDWYHYEFFRGGLDPTINAQFRGMTNLLKGGSYGWTTSIVHASRNDGYLGNHTSYYTDETCTLKFKIADKNGVPVDNANIILWCNPGPYGPGWKNKIGYFWTGFSGELEIEAGAGKQYAFQIDHPDFGYLPDATHGTILTTSTAQNGQTYSVTVNYNEDEMPLLTMNTEDTPDTADYGVFLTINSDEIISGTNTTGYNRDQFALWQDDEGSLAFFICDENNFQKFKNDQPFNAYEGLQRSWKNIKASLPGSGEYYIVLSNQVSTTNIQYFDADCELVSDVEFVSVGEQQSEIEIVTSPNPFSDFCDIKFGTKMDEASVYDLFGRKVANWQNIDHLNWQPDELSKGIYILKAQKDGQIISRKLVYR